MPEADVSKTPNMGDFAMVERDSNILRAVAWSEIFPWLSLVRVFRLAISVRALLLGAVGILITSLGWNIVGNIFGTDSEATAFLQPAKSCPWQAVIANASDRPEGVLKALTNPEIDSPLSDAGWGLNEPVRKSWSHLSIPAWSPLAYLGLSWRDRASLLLCGLIGVAVWAFFGTAICRMAAVQLAADEQVGWGPSLRFACRKWPACCTAPLLPACGVMLATIPVLVLGWIMRADVGLLLAACVWPLALVAGLIMALLLAGLLFGWPLMWGTISTEGTDSFDALSRSYAYVFQRPLHYLFYVAVAGLIGWLGWLVVHEFAAGVIWMAYWSASLGSGGSRIADIMGSADQFTGTAKYGVWIIHFFVGCVKLLAVGYLFSYFWTAITAIYFLLRRDVDATEMDEVFLDADASEPPAALPALAENEPVAAATEENAK
jgi:hypothetical protein